jgi:hypothetical protein
MFCPSCKDEFRAGFTRCANCDVDLVEDLSQVPERPAETRSVDARLSLVEYCGFLELDDARDARERLRAEGIHSDILIRDVPAAMGISEEYWLRVEAQQFRRAATLLGDGAG